MSASPSCNSQAISASARLSYGLGGGIFYLGYSLFEVPSNIILARIGARLTLLRIMLLWGLFSVAMAFMTAPSHDYILRFLVGAAEVGFFPGVLFYLTTWIPVPRRARFTAVFMSAIAVSGIIGGRLSGRHHASPRRGRGLARLAMDVPDGGAAGVAHGRPRLRALGEYAG